MRQALCDRFEKQADRVRPHPALIRTKRLRPCEYCSAMTLHRDESMDPVCQVGRGCATAITIKSTKPMEMLWRGERRTIREWAQLCGLEYGVVRDRLEADWPLEMALLTPKGPQGEHGHRSRRRMS